MRQALAHVRSLSGVCAALARPLPVTAGGRCCDAGRAWSCRASRSDRKPLGQRSSRVEGHVFLPGHTGRRVTHSCGRRAARGCPRGSQVPVRQALAVLARASRGPPQLPCEQCALDRPARQTLGRLARMAQAPSRLTVARWRESRQLPQARRGRHPAVCLQFATCRRGQSQGARLRP